MVTRVACVIARLEVRLYAADEQFDGAIVWEAGESCGHVTEDGLLRSVGRLGKEEEQVVQEEGGGEGRDHAAGCWQDGRRSVEGDGGERREGVGGRREHTTCETNKSHEFSMSCKCC